MATEDNITENASEMPVAAESVEMEVYININQGSKGIRQWSINWCTSPMMIK